MNAATFTVALVRGDADGDTARYEHRDPRSARRRAETLADLHGATVREAGSPATGMTFTVDARRWYARKG